MSSPHFVIAELDSPSRAQALAVELAAFFVKFGAEADAYVWDTEDVHWATKEILPSARALSGRYKARPFHDLTWGDTYLRGIEPVVCASGRHLIIFHDYGATFGPGFLAMLAKTGPSHVRVEEGLVPTSLEVVDPAGRVARKMKAYFEHAATQNKLNRTLGKAPWGGFVSTRSGRGADVHVASEGDRLTVRFPFDLSSLAELRVWLDGLGLAHTLKLPDLGAAASAMPKARAARPALTVNGSPAAKKPSRPGSTRRPAVPAKRATAVAKRRPR